MSSGAGWHDSNHGDVEPVARNDVRLGLQPIVDLTRPPGGPRRAGSVQRDLWVIAQMHMTVGSSARPQHQHSDIRRPTDPYARRRWNGMAGGIAGSARSSRLQADDTSSRSVLAWSRLSSSPWPC